MKRFLACLPSLVCLVGMWLSGVSIAVAADDEPAPPPLPPAGSPLTRHTEFVPIPIYATRPNEGSTYGFMPVFLKVRDWSREIESIYAPSLSYNNTILYTGTFRWFHYPTPEKRLTVTGSVSTRTNWNSLILWENLPLDRGRFTDELELRTERSIFYRFYGFGATTQKTDETSYTRKRFFASYRRGYNLTPRLNLGATFTASHDLVEDIGVPDVPRSPSVFPQSPGMRGSTTTGEFIDLRFDSRRNREYSLKGLYMSLLAGAVQGIWNSPGFFVTQFESRALFPETKWLQGGARFFVSYETRKDAPFYHQSTLGGGSFLRGFPEGRFVDRGAWTLELEQRVRLLRTNIYGVIADWRVDPFIAIGQVYSDAGEALKDIRTSEGLGFRAWIRPNIVGRVDLGYGGEGLKIYVELGYPF